MLLLAWILLNQYQSLLTEMLWIRTSAKCYKCNNETTSIEFLQFPRLFANQLNNCIAERRDIFSSGVQSESNLFSLSLMDVLIAVTLHQLRSVFSLFIFS